MMDYLIFKHDLFSHFTFKFTTIIKILVKNAFTILIKRFKTRLPLYTNQPTLLQIQQFFIP